MPLAVPSFLAKQHFDVSAGIHREPNTLAANMRLLRRNGLIGEFVSIFVHDVHKAVNVACDGGRICRPLIIVDQATQESRITADHIDEITNGTRDFNSLLSESCIEYVDVNEENNCLIALREEDIGPNTTHVEIDPLTILGVVAGLIPYPHHNQVRLLGSSCAVIRLTTWHATVPSQHLPMCYG